MATIYDINKGVNRSIEFKGIKAQYISYLAVGMVLLLLLFATLYAIGVGIYYCLAIVLPVAVGLIMSVQHLSKAYGQHGLTKRMAGRRVPASVQSRSRQLFTTLKTPNHAQQPDA